MRRSIHAGLAVLTLLFTTIVCPPALADDAPFLGADPASVMGQGEKAVQQWISFGHGHVGESFSAIESQTEFDYGVSDRLQLAVLLLYDWHRIKPSDDPAISEGLVGLRGEAVWQVMSADTGPLGLAIAFAPAINSSSRGVAVRMLFTTYIAHFENVLNINFANNWDKDGAGHWQSSSAVVFNYGLAHALDEHWTIGVEVGNQFAFDSILTSADLGSLASTFYAGPTVQYECAFGTITIGTETQLPLSSGDNAIHGYTADAERWRVALRLARSI